MYSSSAEVRSMRRVKCVVIASRVAMLLSRSWPRVDCRALMRGAESMDSEEMGLGSASWVAA